MERGREVWGGSERGGSGRVKLVEEGQEGMGKSWKGCGGVGSDVKGQKDVGRIRKGKGRKGWEG